MDVKSLMRSSFTSSDRLSRPCLEGLGSRIATKTVTLYLGEEDGHMLAAARFLISRICIREGTGLGSSG